MKELDVQFFEKNGFSDPLLLLTEEKTHELVEELENYIKCSIGPNPNNPLQSRHIDRPLIRKICNSDYLLNQIEKLLGPNLVMWASYFFIKEPHGKMIPWHQDLEYWNIDPPINISAWIALTECTIKNSCVEIIPGSHKKKYKHVPLKSKNYVFPKGVHLTNKLKSKIKHMILKPGEFFIFNEKLLHHSAINLTEESRIGLSLRFTLPTVKIEHYTPPLHSGHMALLVRGKDNFHLNSYLNNY